MRKKTVMLAIFALTLAACEKPTQEQSPQSQETKKPQVIQDAVSEESSSTSLEAILEAQTDTLKQRYEFRHPAETIRFFGIEPGMTVIEALPGGGWYSKILLPLLGKEGTLIGADYSLDMWPKFGFFSDERLEAKKTWTTDWPKEAEAWAVENPAKISAFVFGSLPSNMEASADAVLFIRALHNLSRFNDDGGFLDGAIADAFKALKPGGVVGIVQHEARENMPDEWAMGQNGYLKKSYVIEKMQAAGFKFVDESPINENPKDVPSDQDLVWRLPPSLNTSKDDNELREEMKKIGESHRMTLKFQKPE